MSTSTGGEPSAPTAPKTLVIGYKGFKTALTAYGRPTAIGTDNVEYWLTFHRNLTTFDIQGNVIPHLAQKVPSTQDGDWKVFPDGTMEVIWKIRPEAKWQDGMALTADDYAFGFRVVMDPRLAVPEPGEVLNISAVEAPDPQTLVIKWKTLSILSGHNGVVGLPAIPRHLLQDLYQSGDVPAFEASPRWGAEWVGLGPYRLTVWEEGSHIEGQAFDQYVLGRPKIDRVILRTVADVNVLVANLLAGAIDVVPLETSLKPEQIAELQRAWGEKGEAYSSPNAMRTIYLQWRDPSAPWARLAHQRGVIQYPYDPARAERLFAEAGWTRGPGPERLLRNSTGQTIPFMCCRLATGDSNDIRESLAVVAELQTAGFQAQHPLPAAPAGVSSTESRKFTTLNKHANLSPFRFNERGSLASILSQFTASDQNGWTGANEGGWSSPAYDGLFAERMRTFDLTPRQELEFRMVKMIAEELPILPMYYSPVGVAVRTGVQGINRKPHAPPLTQNTTWNINTWEIK